jgi:hypothetical protein
MRLGTRSLEAEIDTLLAAAESLRKLGVRRWGDPANPRSNPQRRNSQAIHQPLPAAKCVDNRRETQRFDPHGKVGNFPISRNKRHEIRSSKHGVMWSSGLCGADLNDDGKQLL